MLKPKISECISHFNHLCHPLINNVLRSPFSSFRRSHQILGISINASLDEIKAAYYRLAKVHHPDVSQHNQNNSPNSTISQQKAKQNAGAKFNQIKLAYQSMVKNIDSQANSKPRPNGFSQGFYSPFGQYQSHQTKNNSANNTNKQKQKQKQRWEDQIRRNSQKYQRQYSQNNNYNEQWEDFQNFYQSEPKRSKFRSTKDSINQERENYYSFTQQQFNQFQKAFNDFLRNGYLKNKHSKFRGHFEDIFKDNTQTNTKKRGTGTNNSWGDWTVYGDIFSDFQQQIFRAKPKMNKKANKRNKNKFDHEYSQNEYEQQSESQLQFEQYQQQQSEQGSESEEQFIKFENGRSYRASTKPPIPKSKHRLKRNDLSQILNIKPSDLGSIVKIRVLKFIACPKCSNSSQSSRSTKSKGQGFQYVNKSNHKCRQCGNRKIIRKWVEDAVALPKNVRDGQILVYPGRGNQGKRGVFGDLVITARMQQKEEEPQVNYKNEGQRNASNNIYSQLKISVHEAVLGCITTLRTSLGLNQIKIPAGVQCGQLIRVRGVINNINDAGNRKKKGSSKDEYWDYKTKNANNSLNNKVRIQLKIPSKITEQQRQIYEKLRELQCKNKQEFKNKEQKANQKNQRKDSQGDRQYSKT